MGLTFNGVLLLIRLLIRSRISMVALISDQGAALVPCPAGLTLMHKTLSGNSEGDRVLVKPGMKK